MKFGKEKKENKNCLLNISLLRQIIFIEVDQRIMNRGVAESDLFTEVNLVSSVSLNVEKKYSLFVMLVDI